MVAGPCGLVVWGSGRPCSGVRPGVVAHGWNIDDVARVVSGAASTAVSAFGWVWCGTWLLVGGAGPGTLLGPEGTGAFGCRGCLWCGLVFRSNRSHRPWWRVGVGAGCGAGFPFVV